MAHHKAIAYIYAVMTAVPSSNLNMHLLMSYLEYQNTKFLCDSRVLCVNVIELFPESSYLVSALKYGSIVETLVCVKLENV